MDKWDKDEAKNSVAMLGSKKALLFLIGIMAVMWVGIFAMSYYALPDDCAYIEKFVGSDEFYNLPESETRQNYIDAQYECNRDNNNIIVR